MELLAVVAQGAGAAVALTAEEGAAGLAINFFWIIVSSLNFLLFLAILYVFALRPVSRMLAERRDRIEQGMQDADQARLERENAKQERTAALAEARKEASEILARAQKVAQETRDADIAATKTELERLRERAAADIVAERERALADLRAEVADLALAAAGKVVGESMTGERQRRLVEEFLASNGAESKN